MSDLGRLSSPADLSPGQQERETVIEAEKLAPGMPGWRRFVWALFLAGFATFNLVFAPQAFLPVLSADLRVTADIAAATVSATALGVAAGVLGWASISDRIGRVRAMQLSLALALLFAIPIPFLPNLEAVLAVRFAEGLVLGAAPAVGMAYIAERVHARSAAYVAGTFVAGNAIGGIVGRLVSGFAADLGGWRLAFATTTIISALVIAAFLIVSRRLRNQRAARSAPTAVGMAANLRDPYMLAVYLQGFLLMGAFGVIYNFFGYYLQAEPFALPASTTSALFIVYLAGTLASQRSGALAARIGTTRALVAGSVAMLVSLPVMASNLIPVMVAGLVLFTVGCFTAHPLASGLSGRSARVGRAQSTALYQIAWLGGTSLFGWIGGIAYASGGWAATLVLGALLCIAAAASAAIGSTVFAKRRTQGEQAPDPSRP
ncbi:MFS transporter [Mycetocola sp.]|uniref:MFS transporter n=1 Tax=Mycetocola sp. TaxID=1871042 RepID=UPI003989ACEB